MDVPVTEFNTLKAYVEKNYGPKCSTFSVACVGCHVWAVLDELEMFIVWDANGRPEAGDGTS